MHIMREQLWFTIGMVLCLVSGSCGHQSTSQASRRQSAVEADQAAKRSSTRRALDVVAAETSIPTRPTRASFQKERRAAPSPQAPDERAFSYNNLGIAYLEQYQYERAAAEFERAVAVNPQFAIGWVNLAIAHYNAGQPERALAELDKAQRLGLDVPQIHYLLGLIHKDRGEFAEALASFRKVLQVDPHDVATNYQMGTIYARQGQYRQAIEHYRTAIAAEPYNASARYGLAIALLRSGDREAGRRAMQRFQHLQKKAYATRIGRQYREQGRYAMALERYPAGRPTTVPVRFVDIATPAGIEFRHGARLDEDGPLLGRAVRAGTFSPSYAKQHLIPAMGSGAVFFDFDDDGDLDLYLVNCSPDGGAKNALYRNDGHARFTDVTGRAGVGFAGWGMGAIAGDYDNDGWVDLYVTNFGRNILYRNNGDGTFTDVTDRAGVGGEKTDWSMGAAFVDYDHDGDLDIYVTSFVDLTTSPPPRSDGTIVFPDDFSGQPNRLYRNNGDGTFTEVARAAGLALDGRSIAVVCTDYNNSRDVDFLVSHYRGSARLLSNTRTGTFEDVSASVGLNLQGRFLGVAAGDENKDGRSDFFIARGEAPGLLYESESDGGFTRKPISPTATTGIKPFTWMGQFVDYDNDGYLDLFLINGGWSPKQAAGQHLQLLRNMGGGRFQDVSSDVGLDRLPPSAARSAIFADVDNDGDWDLLVTQSGGRPWLLRNDGGNRHHWVKVTTRGVRSNRSGIGAKVEVKAGRLWQKLEVYGGSGYLSQSSTQLILGLGDHRTVDFVRVLWPGGVLQSELKLAANRTIRIKELDRKGTSCPILYAWDGRQYRFVTDFLGGSAIGYLLAPGRYNVPDTDEYIKIGHDQLKARDGFYSLKMNNQLEEVIMIDQAQLLVVDHPADMDIFPNERLKAAPPYPEFRLYGVRHARPPVAARDGHGNDILPLIARVDRIYPDHFRLLPFKGYAERHAIELDLGPLRTEPGRRIVLLMTAWIDYADSTSNLAASQAGVTLMPPSLEVPDENGHWVTVLPDMGFPAGLPKTMLVDLTGRFLTDDYRVRIVTNMRIYWDQILVSDQAMAWDESALRSTSSLPLRVVRLSPSRADFRWRGYPREYSPDGRRPLIYDYGRIDRHAPWKTFVGRATRYGDVGELLMNKDDMYVIMLHGDEISLEFDGRSLPARPPGWRRDFLAYADGFGKDMDIHSARPETIEPLPFHGMSAYPYPETERYPTDERHREYRRRYNRRRYVDPLEETDAPTARRQRTMQ